MIKCCRSRFFIDNLEILQLIFPELGITSIKPIDTQKVLEESNDSHGVRLDAYTEDNADRAYDIEIIETKLCYFHF